MKPTTAFVVVALALECDAARADSVASAQARTDPSVGDVVRTNLESSYVSYSHGFVGLEPLWFETRVAPHFSILPRQWHLALFLTPKIVLRMFRETSAPVKTPSYMPRLTAFFWYQDAPDAFAAYYFASFEHHSNGQSGPFQIDGHRNHDTGNFETNSAELGGCLFWPENVVFSWHSVSIEYHPPFLEDANLRASYGDTRVHWATTILTTQNPFVSRLSARFSAILGDMTKPSNASTTLARLPAFVQYSVHPSGVGVGFYGAYYQGQDYYNIWYDRFVSLLEIGIIGSLVTGVE